MTASHDTAGTTTTSTTIQRGLFGRMQDGQKVHTFRLVSSNGPSVTFSEFGASLVSIQMPDRDGILGEVILGYPTLEHYIEDPYYLGAVVGRYANRIREAGFQLSGKRVELTPNQSPHHLHGGLKGFSKKLWQGEILHHPDGPSLRMSCVSPHGDEGYPGTMKVSMIATLTEPGELQILLQAESDRETIVNLTMHPYFNLAGHGHDVLGHRLRIESDAYLELDRDSVPTGNDCPVTGTPLDFRTPHEIGERIDDNSQPLLWAHGYDHCYIWENGARGLKKLAQVEEPSSGRTLELYSTAPGIQFYSGNFLGVDAPSDAVKLYSPRQGFCLEPQAWPDSPNHDSFPDVTLRPGELYSHRIVYRFGATSVSEG